jgi:hypothetical protein
MKVGVEHHTLVVVLHLFVIMTLWFTSVIIWSRVKPSKVKDLLRRSHASRSERDPYRSSMLYKPCVVVQNHIVWLDKGLIGCNSILVYHSYPSQFNAVGGVTHLTVECKDLLLAHILGGDGLDKSSRINVTRDMESVDLAPIRLQLAFAAKVNAEHAGDWKRLTTHLIRFVCPVVLSPL